MHYECEVWTIMKVTVIGAGPAGLLLGASLVRRGHEVVAVDRDPGPPAEGHWPRRGVMQFHHAHGFRPQVGMVLEREWPEAHAAWLAAGAEPITFQMPGGATVPGGHRSRRDTFERALRAGAPAVPGLTLRQGHVDRVLTDGGRARGIVVDGAELAADLVIDASGRSGHAADDVREPAAVGGLCGMAYVDRQYQLHEGAEPGPMTNQIAWQADLDGYQCIVFLHERGFFSVLLVRPTADAALKDLRHAAAFDAACRAIPGLAEWTDPDRARPVTDVLPGGPLRNAYRGQGRPDGSGPLPGLVGVGDSVATTTPTFGRGLTTTFVQIRQLLALLDDGVDPDLVAEPFGAWCDESMLPWVLDHLRMDTDLVRRWQGGDVDVTRRLPSDLIMAASAVDERIGASMPGYLSMLELPSCLDPAEPLARAAYETGWRPPFSPGPTRDELVELVREAVRATDAGGVMAPGDVSLTAPRS
jgi:2-polyprenyl-6-methoxyphenol hydroxylase-like FAD-dependent oxidoreductase